MSSITYSERHTVKLDGKTVGEIRVSRDAYGQAFCYRYHPKGNNTPGEQFFTLEACKRSLEDENDADEQGRDFLVAKSYGL